jgi:hypothetical protein
MRRQKNPGGGDIALIVGGGAALYFLWPQISAMFSGSTAASAPAAVGPGISLIPGGTNLTPNPNPSNVVSVPVNATPAQLAALGLPVPATAVPPATVATAIMAASAQPSTPTPSTGAGLTPGQSYMNSPFGPIQVQAGTPGSYLAGIRMRSAGASGSAAAIAEAAMNGMLAEGGPQVTNSSPIGPYTPGATQLPGGCWQYGNTPVLVNCPPGSGAPRGRAPANGNCLPNFTMNAAGICSNSPQQVALAQLNSTPYAGPQSLPSQPLDPAVLGQYATTVGIFPGSVLAYMLGLPSNPTNGVIEQGNDGFNYQTVGGTYIRQGTATQITRSTGPIGPRQRPFPFTAGTKLGRLRAIAAAVPITNATLIAASNDPSIAALVGNDPRAMLTVPQWNYYYSQASGVLQVAPPYPAIDPNTLVSAQQYQSWRRAAGLGVELQGKLGTIRNSRPGMFPLGGISDGPMRRPFIQPGNTNIYRVPGRGAIRIGTIHSGGGDHRWERSPFPRPADWRMAEQ